MLGRTCLQSLLTLVLTVVLPSTEDCELVERRATAELDWLRNRVPAASGAPSSALPSSAMGAIACRGDVAAGGSELHDKVPLRSSVLRPREGIRGRDSRKGRKKEQEDDTSG